MLTDCYSASVPADKSPVKKEYKEPTTRTDDIRPALPECCVQDADGNFVATWEMKKVEGKLADDFSNAQLFYDSETEKFRLLVTIENAPASSSSALSAAKKSKPSGNDHAGQRCGRPE
ncbi:MAG: hypothetical protein ACLUJU_05310 [Subdoligranulum sp.]